MEVVIVLVVIVVLTAALAKPRRCDVCDTPFKRGYYTWKIEGKKQRLCPNCNRKMERKMSSKKFKEKFS